MLAAFFTWWAAELAELLPAWLRRASPAQADAVVIAPSAHGDDLQLSVRRNGAETGLGEFPRNAAALSEIAAPLPYPTVLRLADTALLERHLNFPLAAQGEIEQVLAFEMDRETPFSIEEVYWTYRVETVDRQKGRITVRLLLIPKAAVAQIVDTMVEAGLEPRWAEIVGPARGQEFLPLNGARRQPQNEAGRLVRPLAACFAVLALAAAATPFVRQSLELQGLDRKVATLRATAAEAEALNREIDQLSRGAAVIQSELNMAGRPLEILANLTRVLPDDSYLTEIELRQRKLTIAGRSSGAARLIGALASDGKFRNPTFAAPVTRLEALRTEVFTITAEVEAGS